MTSQAYEDSMLEHLNSPAFRQISLVSFKARIRNAYLHIRRHMGYIYPTNEKGKRPNIYRYVCETYNLEELQPVKPYLLFKMHKLNHTELKDRVKPPTRLLAPCMKTVGETAARWVDHIVSPVYRRIDTHDLRDTPSLIRSLQPARFPVTSTLSAKDIVALYPSIPLFLGEVYFGNFLKRHFALDLADRILKITRLVLRNNVLRYRQSYYLQTVGTAIGNPLAVVYANVFMYELTRDLVQKYIANGDLLFYRRYIDDIFSVFINPDAHHAFWRDFEQLHPNIRVTGDNADTVDFLDLTISKDNFFAENGRLRIRPYTKPFNKFLYIPWSSFHTRQSKNAWIRAELQRIVRNSDTFEIYLEERTMFARRLRARNYPHAFLTKAFLGIRYRDRSTFLAEHDSKSDRPRPLVFSTQSTPLQHALKISNILRNFWTPLFPEWAAADYYPIVSYSKAPSLWDILRRSSRAVLDQPP
eukprot:1392029-Amorphochlora_amoeboformis.AAC.2